MVFLNSKKIKTPSSAACSHPALGDIMQVAYENILDEIMDHMIESICFESHRALKLGYFPAHEYVVSEHQLERYRNMVMPEEERDIFFNDINNETPMSTCPFCCQKKAAHTLVRHMNLCKRINDNSLNWNNDRRENNDENNINMGNIVKNDVTEDKVLLNGVAECNSAVNNIPRNRIAVTRIENGAFENGIPINRCIRNRRALHTVSMNSIGMNRVSVDRVAMNHVSEDRIALNRISMNRMIMNRIAMNRIVLNRMALNNVAVNRVSMTAVAKNNKSDPVKNGIFGGDNVNIMNDGSGNGIYENGAIDENGSDSDEDYEVNENRNREEENANGDADGREDDYREEELADGDEEELSDEEDEEDTDEEGEEYADGVNDYREANKENDNNPETIIADSVRRSAEEIIDSLASRSAEDIIETFTTISAENIIGRFARRSAEEIMESFSKRSADDITEGSSRISADDIMEGSSRRSADDSGSPDDLSTPESPISDFGESPHEDSNSALPSLIWNFNSEGSSDIILAPESPLGDSNSGSTPWRIRARALRVANRSGSEEIASFAQRSNEEFMVSLSRRFTGVTPCSGLDSPVTPCSVLDTPVSSPSALRPVVLNNNGCLSPAYSDPDSSGASFSVLSPGALCPVIREDVFLTPASTPENSLSSAPPSLNNNPDAPPSLNNNPDDRIEELFSNRCGAICAHNSQPCLNPANCAIHSRESQSGIRRFIFRALSPVNESNSDSDTDSSD